MIDNYLNELEKIDGIQQERFTTLKMIRNTSTKKVGMKEIPISQEEKDILAKKFNKLQDLKIQKIYVNVNQQFELEGKEKLINPFERNEE